MESINVCHLKSCSPGVDLLLGRFLWLLTCTKCFQKAIKCLIVKTKGCPPCGLCFRKPLTIIPCLEMALGPDPWLSDCITWSQKLKFPDHVKKLSSMLTSKLNMSSTVTDKPIQSHGDTNAPKNRFRLIVVIIFYSLHTQGKRYRPGVPGLNAQFWEHIFCKASCFDLAFLILCCLGHMEFGRWFFYPICYDSRSAVVRVQLVAAPARGKWKHFHRN